MSLTILTFLRRSDRRMDYVPPGAGEPETLFGFESWRTEVWASEAARRRGATFLLMLATGNLCVEHDDLPAFRAECEKLLADVEALSKEVRCDPDTLAYRLRNALNAVGRAEALPGGGVIAE